MDADSSVAIGFPDVVQCNSLCLKDRHSSYADSKTCEWSWKMGEVKMAEIAHLKGGEGELSSLDTAVDGASLHQPWLAYSPRQRIFFLAALFFVCASAFMDRAILAILLEPIKQEFALSDAMLGLLGGAPFAICNAISSIFLAHVADRVGRKRIILITMAAWSLMTALCGMANSILVLMLARMGVGAAEGGAIPPAHALLAEYFPPDRRTVAFSIFSSASTVGYAVALSVGGWLAFHYGWRAAFIFIGVASIPIVIACAFILKEPAAFDRRGAPRTSFGTEFRALLRKRSFVYLMAGTSALALFSNGPVYLGPVYMVRTLDVNLAEAGGLYAIATAIGSVGGLLTSSFIGGALEKRGGSWVIGFPVITVLAAIPLAIATYTATSTLFFTIFLTGLIAACWGAIPAVMAGVQYVCGDSRRAVASGVTVAAVNGIGYTFGPLMTGALSDAYWRAGAASLQYAIWTMILTIPLAALLLFMATRHVAADAAEEQPGAPSRPTSEV